MAWKWIRISLDSWMVVLIVLVQYCTCSHTPVAKGGSQFFELVNFTLWCENITIQSHVCLHVAEFYSWVINTFFLVLQFVTVILPHRIRTWTFTKFLFHETLVLAVPVPVHHHHIFDTCILTLYSLYDNNSHCSQNNSPMKRTKPQGKKGCIQGQGPCKTREGWLVQ